MAKNYLFFDIETTGLKPEDGAVILSIGAVAELTGKKQAGQLVEYYGLICPTPEEYANASPDALRVNGFGNYEHLRRHGRLFDDVAQEFMEWCAIHKVTAAKHILVGQNPMFDIKFMTHFLGPQLRFINFPLDEPIDNRDLYSILVNRRAMPYIRDRKGRSSENISTHLGVEPEGFPHTALEGARAAMRNFYKMLELEVREP